MARGAWIVVGIALIAWQQLASDDMVVVIAVAPWPYLIIYQYLPLCMLIAIYVAPWYRQVMPPIIELTAVVIPGLYTIIIISPTNAHTIVAAVRTHNHSNIHVRRYPSTRVYAKKSFSCLYGSKTILHYRLYIQIYNWALDAKIVRCKFFF